MTGRQRIAPSTHPPPHAGHEHGHGHSHAPKDFGKAFLIGVVLNTGFVITEAVYGIVGNSLRCWRTPATT